VAAPAFTLPNGNSHVHSANTGPLRDLLAHPLAFGQPVTKSSQDLDNCTKTVIPGPPSPGSFHRTLTNGSTSAIASPAKFESKNDLRIASQPTLEASTSTPRPSSPGPSIRTPIRNERASSPSRKGKEISSTPSNKQSIARKTEIDVSWPEQLINLKRPAAGLHNPSMACYANATLQVLLHTPPVLRIAQAHDPRLCESGVLCQHHIADDMQRRTSRY
jgi:ubiquitin carboxyl-terminal hydrolase 36/42